MMVKAVALGIGGKGVVKSDCKATKKVKDIKKRNTMKIRTRRDGTELKLI